MNKKFKPLRLRLLKILDYRESQTPDLKSFCDSGFCFQTDFRKILFQNDFKNIEIDRSSNFPDLKFV